jgi:hypothetical protein
VTVDVVVLVPMLGRAHRVRPLLASLAASTDQARALFVCHHNDVDVLAEVRAVGADMMLVGRVPIGDYARKINAGYRATTEPLIFLGASDLHFHPGWLDACRRALTVAGAGVIGTNDLGNPRVTAGQHSTHSLVTRDYVDRYGTIDGPGQVLAECYPHEFVDDELVGTAKHRQAFIMALDARVEHLHPNWHPEVPLDATYRDQQRRMAAGRRLFNRRRYRWR